MILILAGAGDVQWGNVAEWSAAGLALLAVAGSGLLLVAQRRQLKVQQDELRLAHEERQDQEADRRKDQARLVCAWPSAAVQRGAEFEPKTGTYPPRRPGEPYSVGIRYRNGSEEPVFACNVYALSDWGPEPQRFRFWLDVVPPGEYTEVVIEGVELIDGLLGKPPIEMVFTDTRGRHWRRDREGILEELAENPDSGVC